VINEIEGLGHLTNLTWLDLSFNNIKKIEGLNKLTKLTDLSLSNNRIEYFEGLDKLTQLHVLSIGHNLLSTLEGVIYLRQFRNLRMLNLIGNPIAENPEYRPFILSHVNNLVYLDFRRVDKREVEAAQEQFQEETIELKEKDADEEKLRRRQAEHDAKQEEMRQWNLAGVSGLVDAMLDDNADFARLRLIPSMEEGIPPLKEKYKEKLEDFTGYMKDEFLRKEAEHKEFKGVLDGLVKEQQEMSRNIVSRVEGWKKVLARKAAKEPGTLEESVNIQLDELETVRGGLMESEMMLAENIQSLIDELVRNYQALSERSKNLVQAFFSEVRALSITFNETMNREAIAVLDRVAASENEEEIEAFDESVRGLVQDKDQLMQLVQSCHDSNTARIDQLEDSIHQEEARRNAALGKKYNDWAYKRNRETVIEVTALVQRVQQDLRDMVALRNKHDDSDEN